MSTSVVTLMAVAGGALHAGAYVLYVRFAYRDVVRPNPTTWLMWAYGTALLVVLEWDQGAAPIVLLLPAVCAVCSIVVALFCWRRGCLTWPEKPSDRAAFSIDLALTVAYVLLILFEARGLLSGMGEARLKTILLVLVSGSTFVSYWPILRSTRRNPQNEHWLAWAVWTAAYGLLLIVTIASHGGSLAAVQFWLYPLSCLLLTGAVGFYALQEPARALPQAPIFRDAPQ